MAIFIGSDHRGFKIKEAIKIYLAQGGYQAIDLGNLKYEEDDDYPDFASLVAEKVSSDFINSKGIVFCASGVGVDIVANKFPNIRCALACSSDQAVASRNDDDTNMLALAADYLDENQARMIVVAWLQTPPSADQRHKRRIKKIEQIEINLGK